MRLVLEHMKASSRLCPSTSLLEGNIPESQKHFSSTMFVTWISEKRANLAYLSTLGDITSLTLHSLIHALSLSIYRSWCMQTCTMVMSSFVKKEKPGLSNYQSPQVVQSGIGMRSLSSTLMWKTFHAVPGSVWPYMLCIANLRPRRRARRYMCSSSNSMKVGGD